jgi:pyrroline-5-carboxylate reductase
VIPENIYVFDKDKSKTKICVDNGFKVCGEPLETVEKADVTILAVKPQVFPEVLNSIAYASEGKALISIAAGISVSYIKSFLKNHLYVIRVMPNTPLMIGCGATVIASDITIPEKYMNFADRIFSGSGCVEYLTEDKMNEVIGVNGSSPAYFFRMADVMVKKRG